MTNDGARRNDEDRNLQEHLAGAYSSFDIDSSFVIRILSLTQLPDRGAALPRIITFSSARAEPAYFFAAPTLRSTIRRSVWPRAMTK
jgi:hypothetical protein